VLVRGTKILTNFAVLAVSTFTVLLLAEVLLRLIHPLGYLRPPRIQEGGWHQLVHQRSSVPGLAYDLKPDMEKHSQGALIRTNSWGMRDDEPRVGSDEPVFRVVVVGDSVTFGFGVSGDQTYSNVLERLLNGGAAGGPFEVLDLGVGGYSTRDEALTLESKGMRWNPKLIVIGYVLNDPESEPIQPLQSYFQEPSWWQHSALLRMLARCKNVLDIRRFGGGDYLRYLHSPQRAKWQGVVEAFHRMAAMAHARNCPVLLLIFPATRAEGWATYPYRDLHQQVTSAARGAGFDVIDLYDVFSRYAPKDVMLSPKDDHPTPLGHELAAAAIHQWMLDHEKLLALPKPR
jgi:hypothetical protein